MKTTPEKYLDAVTRFLVCVLFISIPFKDSIFESAIVMLNLLFIYRLITENNTRFFRTEKKILFSFGAIFISMSLSNLFGTGGLYGWKEQFYFFARFFLLFYAMIYFLTRRVISLRYVVFCLFLSLGLQVIDGLFQWRYGVDFIKHRALLEGRVSSVVFNPNTFGFIMMVFGVILIDSISNRLRYRLGLLPILVSSILLGGAVTCLLFSGARSAWIGFVVALGTYIGPHYRRFFSAKSLIIGLTAAALVGGMFFTNPALLNRLQLVFKGDSSYRFDMWENAAKLIATAPFLGHGISENIIFFSDAYQRFNSPHNIFLEILSFLGIVGLGAYGYQLILVFKVSIARLSAAPIYVSLFTGIITAGMFDHSWIGNNIFLSAFYLSASLLYAEACFQPSAPAMSPDSGPSETVMGHPSIR